MRRFGEWLAARWAALDLDFQDVHFYGGLLLVAFGEGWRLTAVGAALTLHAWATPFLDRLTKREG